MPPSWGWWFLTLLGPGECRTRDPMPRTEAGSWLGQADGAHGSRQSHARQGERMSEGA